MGIYHRKKEIKIWLNFDRVKTTSCLAQILLLEELIYRISNRLSITTFRTNLSDLSIETAGLEGGLVNKPFL